MERFSLIRVRSPLLTESLLFSLPAGTEMFHFPAFPPRTLCVQMRVTQSPCSVVRGFPIRTSWDQRSVINSPRLIADSYVLLRLLMPRHPPCALKNLTTQRSKTYSREPRATWAQGSFIRNCCIRTPTPQACVFLDARVHYVVLKQQPHQPDHPHTHVQEQNQKQETQKQPSHALLHKVLLPQNPNSAPNTTPTHHTPERFPNNTTPPTKEDARCRTHTRTQHRRPCQKNDSLIFHP